MFILYKCVTLPRISNPIILLYYDMYVIFEKLRESNLDSVVSWLILTYAAVLGACIIDLFCGLYKAVKANKLTTSTGLRKTCTKAQHYFLPMLCLSFADFLAASIVSFPPFTMLWAAFCIACEFKSVLENNATKEQIREAANTMDVVLKNKDDLANVIVELMRQTQCEQKKAGEEPKLYPSKMNNLKDEDNEHTPAENCEREP